MVRSNGITAHRGNSGEHPENTMAALRSAVTLGADWAETDVRVTSDGVLVLCHDAGTGRVGDRDLPIATTTYAELAEANVSAGHPGGPAKLATLTEALVFFRDEGRGTRLSLQPKAEVVEEIFRLLDDLDAWPVIGFNDGSLPLMQQMRSRDPHVPVFWDRHAYASDAAFAEDLATAQAAGFDAMILRHDTVTPERVGLIKTAGLEPGAWTVNTVDEMAALRAMGVHRFYTDYPARALTGR